MLAGIMNGASLRTESLMASDTTDHRILQHCCETIRGEHAVKRLPADVCSGRCSNKTIGPVIPQLVLE